LPTVLGQDLAPDQYEIVVVLDGPDQETAHWLKSLPAAQPRLRVVEQAHRGLAAARNTGLREARAETVLLLDDDLLCSPRLVRRHAEAAADNLIAMGAVPVSGDSPRAIAAQWVRRSVEARTLRLSTVGPQWPVDIALCANYSAPRKLLLACGGFDETLVGACEEFDLGIRASKAGAQFRYLPDAVASEIYVKTAQAMVRRDCPARGANEVRLCRKHPEFRPVSALARFNQGARTRRMLRYAAVRAPFSLEPLMAPAFGAGEALTRLGMPEQVALRLLDFRRSTALYRSALVKTGSWSSFRAEFCATLPVLLYHHVGPKQYGAYPFLTVPPAKFESQMKWLRRRGYTAIRPADWISWNRGAGALPRKPVLITFDDGYADLVHYALPVLKRYNLTATIFVPTQCIGKTNQWDGGTWAQLPLMDQAQIRDWAAQGIEFGAHTRTHPDLTTVSPERLNDEVAESARELESITGSRPLAFAYPYGCFTDQVRDCASRVFDLSFTTREGINCLGDDPFLLHRLEILPHDSLATFAVFLAWGSRPLTALRKRIALRSRLEAAVRRLPRPFSVSPPDVKITKRIRT
jgi:peptidoglycan/xylan/chitin deacetylase (PgdA/CDA1 family)